MIHDRFHTPSSTINAALEELGGLVASLVSVEQVPGEDEQRAPAHSVAGVAVDLSGVGGVVGDAPPVLQVLGVPEEDGADDLSLGGATLELGEGVADDGGTLAVDTMVVSL